MKNMAYWKGKNNISPVKQEVEKKVALELSEEELQKIGPKPPVNVAPPGMTPRPAELDTSTTPRNNIRVYPDKHKPE